MKAKIIKIDPLKESRTEKAFRRIYFIMEDGTWAKTDIVPAYRNFRNWKPIIELFEKGAQIFVEGLEMRNKAEVDADSLVRISTSGFEIIKRQEQIAVQQTLGLDK